MSIGLYNVNDFFTVFSFVKKKQCDAQYTSTDTRLCSILWNNDSDDDYVT